MLPVKGPECRFWVRNLIQPLWWCFCYLGRSLSSPQLAAVVPQNHDSGESLLWNSEFTHSTCCNFWDPKDWLLVPYGPLHSSSLHATIAYSSSTPTWQKCLGQWFPFIVKCLQAGQWASWCFCAMRWPSGFVMGQLWWREAFYCAVSLYVWPLPGYKCLGRVLKRPARASLPHTALQAILTQVRTRRHRHTQQNSHPSTGEQPRI